MWARCHVTLCYHISSHPFECQSLDATRSVKWVKIVARFVSTQSKRLFGLWMCFFFKLVFVYSQIVAIAFFVHTFRLLALYICAHICFQTVIILIRYDATFPFYCCLPWQIRVWVSVEYCVRRMARGEPFILVTWLGMYVCVCGYQRRTWESESEKRTNESYVTHLFHFACVKYTNSHLFI